MAYSSRRFIPEWGGGRQKWRQDWHGGSTRPAGHNVSKDKKPIVRREAGQGCGVSSPPLKLPTSFS